MHVLSRRTLGLAAVPVLFAAAACSGSGDDGTTAPDALDEKRLQAALLTQGELPQGWEPTGGGDDVGADEIAEADRAACQPIMDMVSGRSKKIAPTGQVDTGLFGPGEAEGASHLGINQYKEGQAAVLLQAVRAALPGCAAFGVTQADGTVTQVGVTAGQAPALGDEALRFELAMASEGGTLRIPYTVVRKNSALVISSTLNVADRPTVPVPDQVLATQVDKLTRAQQTRS